MKITNLQPLKDRIQIMEVLERYIDLYKVGASFKASCPFHDERSASFMVSPEKIFIIVLGVVLAVMP